MALNYKSTSKFPDTNTCFIVLGQRIHAITRYHHSYTKHNKQRWMEGRRPGGVTGGWESEDLQS